MAGNKHWKSIEDKIQSFAQIEETTKTWKAVGEKIIFTNGCFDMLHYGHLHYLTAARALGDRLIIGVNSKESVGRLKGAHRPINDDLTRYHLLASLACVDAVVEFEEDTPFDLIKAVLPDVLVKGGDYVVEDIVGADIVLGNGGEVKVLDFVVGYSTTGIEARIRRRKFK
ncbi:MAG: rfaE bifunctional protein nucleotidyltransferase chain/domain [Saprospiraceae bacterium]|jgi:rfaE bifunctional protein nucleotidyltransferase chain/domain